MDIHKMTSHCSAALKVKWCQTGGGDHNRWIDQTEDIRGMATQIRRLMMMADDDDDDAKSFRVTERRRSLCSYQCWNSGGVHWSVPRRHQHWLQNNRRERVICVGLADGHRGWTRRFSSEKRLGTACSTCPRRTGHTSNQLIWDSTQEKILRR